MFVRSGITATVTAVFILFSSPAPCQQRQADKPLRFTLDYKTVHGGLRVAVPPGQRNLPRLGVALAGGGARAAASIGVLKVLQREQVPVNAVAGTSMGAIVGGMYAAGYSPDEIEQVFIQTDWNDVFTDAPVRAFQTQEQKETGGRHLLQFNFDGGRFSAPSGLSAGQKFTNVLLAKTLAASFEANMDFSKLKIPFRAVATDIETGEAVTLGRGLLLDALRASAAIPLVFQPVELQGRLLVDGGLSKNLPVDDVRSLGADMVLAVDSSAKPEDKEHLTSLFEIMSQSITHQVRRETEKQAALADLVITPDTSEFSFADFPRIAEIVKTGEEAARAALPRMREIMRTKLPQGKSPDHYRITSFSVKGNQAVSDVTIRYAMGPALSPHEVSEDAVLASMAEAFRLGYFSDIYLDLRKEGAGYGAVLSVKENPVVKDITASGSTVISVEDIAAAMKRQTGRPLNTTRLLDDLERLVESYRTKGYHMMRVERAGMRPDGVLDLVIYEGVIDSIALKGQEKTRPSLIRREIKTRSGNPLNFDILAEDIQHLYALGYFESVTVDIFKGPKGGIELTFRVKEKPANRVRLGLRYDLEDAFTGLTDIIVDNLTGRGIKLYLNSRYGNYTDLALGYVSPVILRANFLHSIQAFYRSRNYFIYEDKHRVSEFEMTRTGVEASFGYQWFRLGDTHFRYRYSSDTSEETLGLSPVKERERIRSLALLSTIDTRDSSAFPHNGVLAKGSWESAKPAYGNGDGFTKTSLLLQMNLPAGANHTFLLEGSAGLGSGSMPYQEKYGLGGADCGAAVPGEEQSASAVAQEARWSRMNCLPVVRRSPVGIHPARPDS